jgi:electron transfer flavoprotein beta subunit
VVREADGGLETVAFTLPAVITTDLRLNEPRYASLPGIMKARKKPLAEVQVDSLGIDLTPKAKIRNMQAPEKRQAGRKLGSVQELVQALHTDAKVI